MRSRPHAVIAIARPKPPSALASATRRFSLRESSSASSVSVPAVKLAKENVIDTTAAGDSFSAGYLAVRLTGGTPEAAAQRGHLTASTVIQYRGAIIPREAMPV